MGSRHPLPYGFAKANTLLLEDDGVQRVLYAGDGASMSALAEVLRLYDVQQLERDTVASLSQRIAAAYAGGESSAAAVIGEVESAVDLTRLMQDLPAVEDLLEAANDAPIIRMLNALLTQAAKDGASDIHIEPYERELGALPHRRHAARGGAAEPRAARGADLAHQDHGRARHRREAPAAGRPHLAAHRPARDRRARLDPADARTASAWCCACSTRAKRCSRSSRSA